MGIRASAGVGRSTLLAAIAAGGLGVLATASPASGQPADPTQPGVAAAATSDAPSPPPPEQVADHFCGVDLSLPGTLKDVISNALSQGLQLRGSEVSAFLDGAQERFETSDDLYKATAAHFGLDEAALRLLAEQYRHCNCGLDPWEDGIPGRNGMGLFDHVQATPFARDVVLHVVLHEMGHALIREFDILVLGNEETVADAFATHYLTTYMPDRAVEVLVARVTSLMIEATDEPADDWTGEHDHDGRRAFKIAAIAIAADPAKYAPVAAAVGMSEDDIGDAADYGTEVHRSWRRVLSPLWMPVGELSNEARVQWDESSPFVTSVCGQGLADEIEAQLRRFDWHTTVTVDFVDDQGGAGWSRSSRTITVKSEYVHRFVLQGQRGLAARE